MQSNVRMGKKCNLSDFDSGMIVGARQGGLSVSVTTDLLYFSQTTVLFAENGVKNPKKTCSDSSSAGRMSW